MLNRLYVKNIALIEEADVEFDKGLNILSGETGSGKSVILDSINFILGSKADKSMIRYGENEALVKAEFTVDEDSLAAAALRELEIETDGSLIITRRFSADGKSSIKINGNSVTVSMLKSVTSHLVDVHGQSEHFFLLNESNQLKVVDNLCGNGALELKDEIKSLIDNKKNIKRQIDALGGDEQERERRLDLLSYQINEISSAELRIGEFEELKARQNVINNVEKILNALNGVKNILSEDGGVSDMLSLASRQMSSVSDIDDNYEKIYSRLENLGVEAEDISETVSDLSDDVSFDGQEAQYIEERLSLIKNLKKKYGADEEQILQYLEKAESEFDSLSNCAETIEKLNNELNNCNDKIFSLCIKLTELRRNTCNRLCKNVEEQLKTLNIPNARFTVEFNEYDRATANLLSNEGADEIKFLFSANKGEPLKPLNKVISGGEMSRFMLAIKTQLKDLNGISTYIFDEIDAGISGLTAKSVADKFIDISKATQIIAVSHLPQVCAASSSQYLIYKIEDGSKTITKVKKLSREEKIDEIVRLTGSVDSQAAREHAIELIEQFN